MWSRPMVHNGYMKCWLAGGFNFKVLTQVQTIVNGWKQGAPALQAGPHPTYQIFVTGMHHDHHTRV